MKIVGLHKMLSSNFRWNMQERWSIHGIFFSKIMHMSWKSNGQPCPCWWRCRSWCEPRWACSCRTCHRRPPTSWAPPWPKQAGEPQNQIHPHSKSSLSFSGGWEERKKHWRGRRGGWPRRRWGSAGRGRPCAGHEAHSVVSFDDPAQIEIEARWNKARTGAVEKIG